MKAIINYTFFDIFISNLDKEDLKLLFSHLHYATYTP